MTEDIRDIERLIHLYAHRIDAGDIAGFAALFEHGTLHFRGLAPPATGIDEVRDLISRLVILYDGSPRTNHVMANTIIEVADDRASATGRTYVQILHSLPDEPIATIATAIYDDQFVRRSDTWWFGTRVARASLVGDMRTHLRPAPGR
jgi:SnoaL-like domain